MKNLFNNVEIGKVLINDTYPLHQIKYLDKILIKSKNSMVKMDP